VSEDTQDLLAKAKKHEDDRRKRQMRSVLNSILLVAVLLAGILFYADDRSDDSDRNDRLKAVEGGYAALYEQVEKCKDQTAADSPDCGEPVAPPIEEVKPEVDGDSKPKLPSVITRVEQVSPSQVQNAVFRYCSATEVCEGEDATAAQVRAAVAAYCDARGQCTPPPPSDGKDGKDGADSNVAGPQGPPPSDEQVEEAVNAYCSNDRCKGPKGDKGDPGNDGAPGKDFTCPDGYTLQTFTVQTSLTETAEVYGCRA
jgi:hypothetical protein